MNEVTDIAGSGGGGFAVGWVFFFIIVIGAYIYNNTTSYDRYRVKKWITAIFGYMAVLAFVVWLWQ